MQRRLGVGPAMASGTSTISMIDLYLAYLVLGSSPWEIDLHSRSNQGNKSFVIYPVNISDTFRTSKCPDEFKKHTFKFTSTAGINWGLDSRRDRQFRAFHWVRQWLSEWIFPHRSLPTFHSRHYWHQDELAIFHRLSYRIVTGTATVRL